MTIMKEPVLMLNFKLDPRYEFMIFFRKILSRKER